MHTFSAPPIQRYKKTKRHRLVFSS
jgi:hypothetical protein